MSYSDEINDSSNDINPLSEDSDSEVQEVTAAQLLQLMEVAWSNEKFAPEILPHKHDVVELLLGQITYIQDNMSNVTNDDLRNSIHQMELERIRYLVSSYLRTRLEKIETFVYSILKEESERSAKSEDGYLSLSELKFAEAYKEGLDQHFTETLKFLPAEIVNPKSWQNDIITPNLDAFVFAKAKEAIENIMIDRDEEFAELTQGSQALMSYSNISNFIRDNKISLI